MKKDHVRYRKELKNGMVASVYIDEVYHNKPVIFTNRFGSTISIYYHEIVGACVGRSRRECNDWWNGDKRSSRFMDNKMTGKGNDGFLSIVSMMKSHIAKFMDVNGYYCVLIDGTDGKRVNSYDKIINRFCQRNNYELNMRVLEGGLLYLIRK